MTARDLIQQRETLNNGDTIWRNSPLVTAALEGKIALLDGIHRVHTSTLAILHRFAVCNCFLIMKIFEGINEFNVLKVDQ